MSELALADRLDVEFDAQGLVQPPGECSFETAVLDIRPSGLDKNRHLVAPGGRRRFQNADVFAVRAEVLSDQGADGFREDADAPELHHIVGAPEYLGQTPVRASAGTLPCHE